MSRAIYANSATNLPLPDPTKPDNSYRAQYRVADYVSRCYHRLLDQRILDVELLRSFAGNYSSETFGTNQSPMGTESNVAWIMLDRAYDFFGSRSWVPSDLTSAILQRLGDTLSTNPPLPDDALAGHHISLAYVLYQMLAEKCYAPCNATVQTRYCDAASIFAAPVQILPLSSFPKPGYYVDGSTISLGDGSGGFASSIIYNVDFANVLWQARLANVRVCATKRRIVQRNVADMIYGKFVVPIGYGPSLTRVDTPSLLSRFIGHTQGYFGQSDYKDAVSSAHSLGSPLTFAVAPSLFQSTCPGFRNAGRRLYRKLEGFYAWYGSDSGDYDGYVISRSIAKQRTGTQASYADVADQLVIQSSMHSGFWFTDEPILRWAQLAQANNQPFFPAGSLAYLGPNSWLYITDGRQRTTASVASLSGARPSLHAAIDVVFAYGVLVGSDPFVTYAEQIFIVDRLARGVTVITQTQGTGTLRYACIGGFGADPIAGASNTEASIRLRDVRPRYAKAVLNCTAYVSYPTFDDNAETAAYVEKRDNAESADKYASQPSDYVESQSGEATTAIVPIGPYGGEAVGGWYANDWKQQPTNTLPPSGLPINVHGGVQFAAGKPCVAFASSVSNFQPPECVTVTDVAVAGSLDYAVCYSTGRVSINIQRFTAANKNRAIVGGGDDTRLFQVNVMNDGRGRRSSTIIDAAQDPVGANAVTSVDGHCMLRDCDGTISFAAVK